MAQQATTPAWLQAVDLKAVYPDDEFVELGFSRASPFEIAATRSKDPYEAILSTDGRELTSYETAEALTKLRQLDEALLHDGPSGIEGPWRSVLGTEEVRKLTYRWRKTSSGYRDQQDWSYSGNLPNMLRITPGAAALYLAAIGRLKIDVPISFARDLLRSRFDFPEDITVLCKPSRTEGVMLSGLDVDKNRALVLASPSGSPGGTGEAVQILSRSWRRRRDAQFEGYQEDDTGDAPPIQDCLLDHDGSRLVSLSFPENLGLVNAILPVVPISEILPEVIALLEEVKQSPAEFLDPLRRTAAWSKRVPIVGRVARRLVEGILSGFAPWPFPFVECTEEEKRLNQAEVDKRVLALFSRFIAARNQSEPPDVQAHFLALIKDQRFLRFTTWQLPLSRVWGFKIRTGDHDSIKGAIWMQPGERDLASPVLSFDGARTRSNSYSDGKMIRCGAVRCTLTRTRS